MAWTARNVYEATLIELNKVLAPSILLEDFNYFINKAIFLYVNKHYTLININMLVNDALKSLISSTYLQPDLEEEEAEPDDLAYLKDLELNTSFTIPEDYLHLLSCICIFEPTAANTKCGKNASYVKSPAQRLTEDAEGVVINNYYNKPSYKKPYYRIYSENLVLGETIDEPETEEITLGIDDITTRLNVGERKSNPSKIHIEIICGDLSLYELKTIKFQYLRSPQHILLTQTQLDTIEDTSLQLEWPDYVCDQLVNELVHLVLENSGSADRLLTHAPITNSITLAEQLNSK